MKNLEELTFEESKQLSGGSDILEPWHGLPRDFFRYRIKRWYPNIAKGNIEDNSKTYSKNYI